MHFAYPPRKNSNPPPFRPRSTRIPTLRRSRLKIVAIAGLTILFLLWLFSGSSPDKGPQRIISGKPPVVIVTAFDEKSWVKAPEYLKSIKENREQYAELHGYKALLVSSEGYDLNGAPITWSKVTATRHALTLYPDCKYVWYLDQHAFIMNPNIKIEDMIMSSSKIEAAMIKDLPVVPPDSIIKTFSHLKGDDVELVLTQDKNGLSAGSFIVKNGDWAQFFLETWFDPLYRSYNFQKAETHALEHIVQWHPTILSKLAVIPQRLINAYSQEKHGVVYQEGDLAVRFQACAKQAGENNCAEQAAPYMTQWRKSFASA